MGEPSNKAMLSPRVPIGDGRGWADSLASLRREEQENRPAPARMGSSCAVLSTEKAARSLAYTREEAEAFLRASGRENAQVPTADEQAT